MIHLINIVTTFSALEDRKVKAIHFNRIHKTKLSFLLLKFVKGYTLSKRMLLPYELIVDLCILL